MIDSVVTAFPVLVGSVAVIVLVLAVRLDRSMGRAAFSAGPRDPERPTPPGQTRTPWELQAIEDQLKSLRLHSGRAVPRYDLNATVNRLIVAARFDESDDQLPITADEAEVADAIARIEDRLGLPPLEDDQPSGSRVGRNGRTRRKEATRG